VGGEGRGGRNTKEPHNAVLREKGPLPARTARAPSRWSKKGESRASAESGRGASAQRGATKARGEEEGARAFQEKCPRYTTTAAPREHTPALTAQKPAWRKASPALQAQKRAPLGVRIARGLACARKKSILQRSRAGCLPPRLRSPFVLPPKGGLSKRPLVVRARPLLRSARPRGQAPARGGREPRRRGGTRVPARPWGGEEQVGTRPLRKWSGGSQGVLLRGGFV